MSSQATTPRGNLTVAYELKPLEAGRFFISSYAYLYNGDQSALEDSISEDNFQQTTVKFASDSDGDGIPDTYELRNNLNFEQADGAGDQDGDGLSDRDEYLSRQ